MVIQERLVLLVCVNVEIVKHAKVKEQVHIVTQKIINVNVQKMLMLVLIPVKPANQAYVNAALRPVVLVKLPEPIVMLQITNVNVQLQYRRVRIQGKRVALEPASVGLLQHVLVRHLGRIAMLRIAYASAHRQ